MFSIGAISTDTYTLQISCIGYWTQKLQDIVIGAGKAVSQNITLSPSIETLGSVEIVDYSGGISKMPNRSAEGVATSVSGAFSKDGEIGMIRGARSSSEAMYVDGIRVSSLSGSPQCALSTDEKQNSTVRKQQSQSSVVERTQNTNATPMQQIQSETTFEFDIKTPYTIPSDGKNYTIMIDDYMIPAAYQYIAAPRANDNIFLTALLTDWTKYNLLSGVSNIFFENTYIGKTDINSRTTSDTLNLSLGSDKGIMMERKLQKDHSTTKTIGSKTEVTKSWKITVKNNKTAPVDLVLTDQIPVSAVSSIEIKALALSEGVLEENTGIITWKLSLAAGEMKEIELKYVVKYPKGSHIYIE
jgi:hypothetical protein